MERHGLSVPRSAAYGLNCNKTTNLRPLPKIIVTVIYLMKDLLCDKSHISIDHFDCVGVCGEGANSHNFGGI